MLSPKKLLILVGILVALGTYVYFYEIRGKEQREKKEEESKKLLQLDADKVTRVSLLRRKEPQIVFAKSGGSWKITQPIQTNADSTSVDGLVQSLAGATSDRTIENPDLAKYGLKDPSVTVTVEEGGKKQTVRFGEKDFSGGNVYVAKGNDPKVYLVSDSPYVKATQSVGDFRDKNIFATNMEGADKIEISGNNGTIVIKKEKDRWNLQQPSSEPADATTVDALVNGVRFGRIQTFADESLTDLKKYGLDPPAVKLTLFSGDKKAELNLGNKQGENYYAYVPGRTVIFTVPKDIFEKTNQSADQFLSRDVVHLDRDKIRKIQITAEKGKWAAEKKGDKWMVTEPAGKDKKNFQDYRVFLALEDLRADKVLKAGSVSLSSPLVVCQLTTDAAALRVEIFKKGIDWYARSSQADKIFKITEARGQALNQPVDSFLE
jgi:hypothetical protein